MLGHQMMGQPMMQGYNYNPQMMGQAQTKVMNNLTEDEIKMLQQTATQFSLGLTQREQLQGACNHRSADGMRDTLVYDEVTGIARCTICGYEFRPLEPNTSIDDINEAKDKIIDILQTIKLLYTDLPAEAGREYFQVIPLLMKLPELFQFAAKNFSKHEIMNGWQYQGQNMGGIAMLQNLGNFLGSGMNPMYMQQPQMVNPQQPMGGMAAGYPQAAYGMPGQNAFGYNGASQPMMSQPVNTGYAYQPGQVSTPVQPTVAAPTAPVTPADAATETVTTTVKA